MYGVEMRELECFLVSSAELRHAADALVWSGTGENARVRAFAEVAGGARGPGRSRHSQSLLGSGSLSFVNAPANSSAGSP
ncbi:hypothetical protein SAMN05421505_1637 [Sinosporangium album]|uniref:Uncharacterized protein n=1 Tax=Sinosporangium album TaxID=504805 RepID=A0A1G8L9I2_9ACTN|nr:hypothetical protein SAMN05421505_1637 [Sinosporangium album]